MDWKVPIPVDLDLEPEKNAEAIFGRIRCVMIDLSGTLHVGNEATELAVESLQRLRQLGLQIRFVTNTTKESKRLLLERLRSLGFEIEEQEIFTSLLACRKLIEAKNYNPFYLVHKSAMEDFPKPASTSSEIPNAVVVGLSPDTFDYLHLNRAFKLLQSGAQLIGIHEGRYYETGSGLSLGPGPFVKLLEYSANSKAVIVGKPQASFFLSALESSGGCSPEECVMIGDDVRDDVLGAINAGMKAILVQTGKYREGDENIISPCRPDLLARNFAAAVHCIEKAISSKSNCSSQPQIS